MQIASAFFFQFLWQLHGNSRITYLSTCIFIYILTLEGDIRRKCWGVSFFLVSYLKRNIQVHNKDLSCSKTLVRPQLEFSSTVWYPHHDKDINKVEAVQRRAARWATRNYTCRYTSSITAMLKDLNWHPLDQHHIDSRLLMYKVTYDLVSIPAPEYLVRDTRQSRHSHSLRFVELPEHTKTPEHTNNQ